MAGLLSDRVGKTEEVVLIPAAVDQPRGIYYVTLAAICASIFAFFAALIFAYWWRSQTREFWNPVALPWTLWLSSAILAVSSVTCEIGRRMFARGLTLRSAPWMIATAALGAAFLASQITSWRQLAEQGAYLSANPHGSFFYLFTAAHAAHLIGGLVALAILLLRARKRRELVDAISYYWHFLGVLWALLFATLLIF